MQRSFIWAGVVLAFGLLVSLLSNMLLPFILGMLIAYLLDPAADKLEEWGCSRSVATSILTLLFFALLLVVLLLLVPLLIRQLGGLMQDLPSYVEALRHLLLTQFSRLPLPIDLTNGFDIKSLVKEFLSGGQEVAGSLIRSGVAVLNALSLLVVTPVVAFYLLRDWDRIVEKIDQLLPRNNAETIREQARKVDETLAGFLRGQLNVMLVLGSFYAVALYAAGLKYGIVIGLIAGFLIIIPYLGTIISGVLATGIAYMQFQPDWVAVAVVLGIFIIGQVLEGYVLTPRLVGNKVGLHPVWIIFGMLAGASLFGFLGILLAVPVSAIIGVLVRFALERYQHSALYQGD